ncbi:MAG: VOC family protein, partial [Nocardioidaceae bacterium]
MTTRVLRVSVPVPDEDRALRFYVDALGFELSTDVEVAGRSAGRGRSARFGRRTGAT